MVGQAGTNVFQLSSFNQGMVWSGGATTQATTFTADAATNTITLSGNAFNYQTGVPVTLSTSSGGATFTADIATDILTLSTSNANFVSGNSLKFSTTGTLPTTIPTALNTTDTFYSVMVGVPTTTPGTIKIATTLAAALAGTPTLDVTVAGAPVNTINATSQLPAPLGALV